MQDLYASGAVPQAVDEEAMQRQHMEEQRQRVMQGAGQRPEIDPYQQQAGDVPNPGKLPPTPEEREKKMNPEWITGPEPKTYDPKSVKPEDSTDEDAITKQWPTVKRMVNAGKIVPSADGGAMVISEKGADYGPFDSIAQARAHVMAYGWDRDADREHMKKKFLKMMNTQMHNYVANEKKVDALLDRQLEEMDAQYQNLQDLHRRSKAAKKAEKIFNATEKKDK